MSETLTLICTDRGQHNSAKLTSVDWTTDNWDTSHASARWVDRNLRLHCRRCRRSWLMGTERVQLLRQWPGTTVDISAID